MSVSEAKVIAGAAAEPFAIDIIPVTPRVLAISTAPSMSTMSKLVVPATSTVPAIRRESALESHTRYLLAVAPKNVTS